MYSVFLPCRIYRLRMFTCPWAKRIPNCRCTWERMHAHTTPIGACKKMHACAALTGRCKMCALRMHASDACVSSAKRCAHLGPCVRLGLPSAQDSCGSPRMLTSFSLLESCFVYAGDACAPLIGPRALEVCLGQAR